jgi:membrane-anchored mycosin MYCP
MGLRPMGGLTARRGLAVYAALGTGCLMLALAAAAPARAVPAAPGRPAGPDQTVQSLEWWFSQWGIRTYVWPLSRGAGVTVALLDTGVQANLPDIRAAVVPGADVAGGGGEGWTDNLLPTGHGTGIASLIAGQGVDGGVLGIAPEAKILPVVVSNFNTAVGAYTDATLAAGIRYAVDRGAQVINMSLGGDTTLASVCDTPQLQDAVAYAVQHNVVLVAAAGNDGKNGNPPDSPASCAGVLAVGAVGPNLRLWSQSERQPYVAVAAPGALVVNLAADGGNNIGNGTSSATAFVSGTAALIRSRYPSMPWYTVVQRIINTTLPKGGSVPNDSYGYGIVRIGEALNVAKYPVPASAPNPVYSAYQGWLQSPQGQQFLAAGHPRPRPSRTPPAAAPASAGGSARLIAVIAAAVVVVAGGAALSIAALRRRRRRYT